MEERKGSGSEGGDIFVSSQSLVFFAFLISFSQKFLETGLEYYVLKGVYSRNIVFNGFVKQKSVYENDCGSEIIFIPKIRKD